MQLNQEKILNKIDLEKQVMIEAYIVNATDGFNKNFSANLELEQVNNVRHRDRITMFQWIQIQVPQHHLTSKMEIHQVDQILISVIKKSV